MDTLGRRRNDLRLWMRLSCSGCVNSPGEIRHGLQAASGGDLEPVGIVGEGSHFRRWGTGGCGRLLDHRRIGLHCLVHRLHRHRNLGQRERLRMALLDKGFDQLVHAAAACGDPLERVVDRFDRLVLWDSDLNMRFVPSVPNQDSAVRRSAPEMTGSRS